MTSTDQSPLSLPGTGLTRAVLTGAPLPVLPHGCSSPFQGMSPSGLGRDLGAAVAPASLLVYPNLLSVPRSQSFASRRDLSRAGIASRPSPGSLGTAFGSSDILIKTKRVNSAPLHSGRVQKLPKSWFCCRCLNRLIVFQETCSSC